jgi:lactose/L-arabinose transport system ATP-binding protein
MSSISLRNVGKRFGTTETIHAVDLDIAAGEFAVFVGPSGCGKSTLLRMIAGLEAVSSGSLHIGEREVTKLPPSERRVAMVFQSYALYPHMTVRENLSFGMRMRGVARSEIERRVAEAATLLRLEPYMARKPSALSGGQAQRVAIGRALVQDPDVFLFDEPLSNLDAELRLKMRVELAALHQRLGKTMVYVTHDQVEAMTLANRIVVLRDGRIEQVGSPLDLYRAPVNQFVAGFLGSPAMNFLSREAFGASSALGGRAPTPTNAAVLGVRPEALRLSSANDAHILLRGCITMVERLGAISYAYVTADTAAVPAGVSPICVELRGEQAQVAQVGDLVGVSVDAASVHWFDASGARIATESAAE